MWVVKATKFWMLGSQTIKLVTLHAHILLSLQFIVQYLFGNTAVVDSVRMLQLTCFMLLLFSSLYSDMIYLWSVTVLCSIFVQPLIYFCATLNLEFDLTITSSQTSCFFCDHERCILPYVSHFSSIGFLLAVQIFRPI